jgi:hypothetical protein
MAKPMKSKPRDTKAKPFVARSVEYLSAENLEEQAEGELLTEWLNGLSIPARLTLAARLLNFTAEDLRPSDAESALIRERIASVAGEIGYLARWARAYDGFEIEDT